jgi:hypothetical protein
VHVDVLRLVLLAGCVAWSPPYSEVILHAKVQEVSKTKRKRMNRHDLTAKVLDVTLLQRSCVPPPLDLNCRGVQRRSTLFCSSPVLIIIEHRCVVEGALHNLLITSGMNTQRMQQAVHFVRRSCECSDTSTASSTCSSTGPSAS